MEDVVLDPAQLDPMRDGRYDPGFREAIEYVTDRMTGAQISVEDLRNDFDLTQAPLPPRVLLAD